ncbi:MAG: response regulator [Desulfobacterales bacterium]|nr:response regulator [Desulfobacterales bacterium]
MSADEKPVVIILEDLSENFHALMALLEPSCSMIPVTGGEAVLERLEREPLPDLVILDIVMPDMDGYEVCSRIKENPVTAGVPVIFITAVSEAMDDARAFKLGAVDYITKPFNPLTVRARIRTHIKLSRTLKELQTALDEIEALSGLIPICASCKKIRDDKGYWRMVDTYFSERSKAVFSHGICPDCRESLYPEYDKKKAGG